MNPHGAAGLVGPIVQGASALLLLVVFLLVLRFSSRRPFLRTWVAIWAAQLAVCASAAVDSIAMLAGISLQAGITTTLLGLISVPGQFVFLAMVTIGALEATGRSVLPRLQIWIAVGAAAIGSLIALAGLPMLANQIQVIATPILLFGSAQFVLAGANSPRRRGMLSLALALMFYGTLASLYLLAGFVRAGGSLVAQLATAVSLSSGYGDAIALTILGAAVMVLVIQDGFLEAVAARDEQLRDLVSSKRRLHDIIQAAGEAILTIDDAGKIEIVNQAAEQLFGLSPGAAAGMDLRELLGDSPVPPGDPSQPHASLVSARVGEGQRSNGSRFPVEYTVASLRGVDQTGGVVVVRDLTQRREAEAQRELSERRLAESEKVLAVSRVVSSVIHELEHPLTTVLDQSERLLQSSGPAGTLPGLRLINDQASRARHIMRDLLAFVRTGPDRGDAVDLGVVVRDVATVLAKEATHRDLTLITEVPERALPARASRASVEQIVRGLLDNAMEAAGTHGTVRVSVRVVGREVEVVVEDSGAGVPEELTHLVFEPSFTTKSGGKATGLGLSISGRVARAFGGALRLENHPVPGVGARFVLSLPTTLSDAAGGEEA